jgi:hypothetical protein
VQAGAQLGQGCKRDVEHEDAAAFGCAKAPFRPLGGPRLDVRAFGLVKLSQSD